MPNAVRELLTVETESLSGAQVKSRSWPPSLAKHVNALRKSGGIGRRGRSAVSGQRSAVGVGGGCGAEEREGGERDGRLRTCPLISSSMAWPCVRLSGGATRRGGDARRELRAEWGERHSLPTLYLVGRRQCSHSADRTQSLARGQRSFEPGPCTPPATHPLTTVRPLPPSSPPGLTDALARRRADYFDSAEYVHRFEQQGLSKQQAEGVVDALEAIVQESMDNLESNLVSRSEHYKVRTPRRAHGQTPG